MQADKRQEQIAQLIADTEDYIGREMKTPEDFQHLLNALPKEEPLSMSTLKRLWQYVPNEHKTREVTLTILARLLGYRDWQHYCTSHRDPSESDFLTGMDTQRDISKGTTLALTWHPDRQCVIRKTDNDRFLVVSATNAKLKAGDEFFTAWMEEGKPLLATRFTRDGQPQPDYIAGKRNGLSSIRISKTQEKIHNPYTALDD